MVKAQGVDRSPLFNLVLDIKSLLSASRVCLFVKVERSQIRINHHLASLARVGLSFRNLVWCGGLKMFFSYSSLIVV
jgi:hypothetical protein